MESKDTYESGSTRRFAGLGDRVAAVSGSHQQRTAAGDKERSHRPVVTLIGLYGDGGTVALHEVCLVVDVLEPTGTNDGVDMGSDLCDASECQLK